MVAVKKDLYIEQGASFIWPFQWCQPGPLDEEGNPTPGLPRDLTGWVFRMQVRKKQGDPIQIDASTTTGNIIIGVDPTDPGMTPDPTNGWVIVQLTPTDTNALTTKTGEYDLEGVAPSGYTPRLWEGATTHDANITQAGGEPVEV